jgi:hypothetical protein
MAGRFASMSASCRSGLRSVPRRKSTTEGVKLSRHCQQGAEVGVRRDKNAIFVPGAGEDRLVLGCMQSVVARVHRIVAGFSQAFGMIGDSALSTGNFTSSPEAARVRARRRRRT